MIRVISAAVGLIVGMGLWHGFAVLIPSAHVWVFVLAPLAGAFAGMVTGWVASYFTMNATLSSIVRTSALDGGMGGLASLVFSLVLAQFFYKG